MTELEQGRPRPRSTAPTITFLPDLEIFEEIEFDFQTLAERLRETAFLTRGLKIELIDERGETNSVTFQYDGGIEDFVRHLNENKDALHQKVDLLRGRQRGRRSRDRDAVEQLLPGVDLQLRQQHQHPRGRHPPLRLPRGADPDPERLRPQQRPAERERRQPRRRGRARGADRGDLGQAARPPVRGPDQDQTRQPADQRPGRGDGQPQTRRVPRGEPGRGATDHQQGDRRLPRPRRRRARPAT